MCYDVVVKSEVCYDIVVIVVCYDLFTRRQHSAANGQHVRKVRAYGDMLRCI